MKAIDCKYPRVIANSTSYSLKGQLFRTQIYKVVKCNIYL